VRRAHGDTVNGGGFGEVRDIGMQEFAFSCSEYTIKQNCMQYILYDYVILHIPILSILFLTVLPKWGENPVLGGNHEI